MRTILFALLGVFLLAGCRSSHPTDFSYIQEEPLRHFTQVKVGDTIEVTVPAGVTPGYQWEIQDQYHWELTEMRRKKADYLYTFTARFAGEGALVLVYRPDPGTFVERSLKSITIRYNILRDGKSKRD